MLKVKVLFFQKVINMPLLRLDIICFRNKTPGFGIISAPHFCSLRFCSNESWLLWKIHEICEWHRDCHRSGEKWGLQAFCLKIRMIWSNVSAMLCIMTYQISTKEPIVQSVIVAILFVALLVDILNNFVRLLSFRQFAVLLKFQILQFQQKSLCIK